MRNIYIEAYLESVDGAAHQSAVEIMNEICSDMKKLQSENSTLKKELDGCRMSWSNSKNALSELEAENSTLKKELDELKASLDSASKLRDGYSAEVDDKNEEIDELKAKLDEADKAFNLIVSQDKLMSGDYGYQLVVIARESLQKIRGG